MSACMDWQKGINWGLYVLDTLFEFYCAYMLHVNAKRPLKEYQPYVEGKYNNDDYQPGTAMN